MSDNFYKQLINQLPVGYAYHKIMCDEMGTPCDYVFVEVNEVFEELTGLRGADIIGKPITKVLPEIGKSEFDWIAHYGEIALKGSKKKFEQFSEPLNRWYSVNAYSPKKGYFITIFSDISSEHRQINELHKLTEALRESEARYRRLAENAKDIIYRISLVPERRFEYINPAVSDITGYTPEEHYADPDLGMKMVHPQDYHLIEKAGRGEIPSGEPLTLRWLRKDGQVIWTEQRNILLHNEEGIPIALEGIARDITVRKQVEEALHESEQFIRSTLDGLSSHIAVINEGGEIVLTNKAYRDFAEANKLDPSTVSEGCNYLAVCDAAQGEDSEDAGFFAQGIREVLSGKHPSFELEYSCHSPDEQRWFLGRVTPFKSDSPRRVVIAHENITARIQAEAAARKSEENLKDIIESTLSGYWDWDLVGNTEYLSPAFKRMFGYEDHEMESSPEAWQRIIFPEDLPRVLEDFDRHVKSHGREPFHNEVRYRHKDGSTVWVICAGRVNEWAEDGTALSMIGCHIDITERKLAEYVSRKSEDKYRILFEHSVMGIYLHDTKGRIIDVNNVASLQLKYSKEELLNLNVFDLHPNEAGTVNLPKDEILRQWNHWQLGQQLVIEGEHQCKDGTIFPVLISTGPLMYEEDRLIIAMVQDITERKHVEAELQRFTEEIEHQQNVLLKRLHQSVNAISKIGELRDVYTAGHQKRVAELTCAIGREMGLTDEKISSLSYGGLLHDVGKFFIPSDILNKPGKVSSLEYKIIQTHVKESYNVVKEIDFPEEIHTMIYQHHERLDGSGYPQGLSGDEIILQSRIMAVADVVEAMSSYRPHRAALGIDAALEEIELHKGTRFDTDVVEICIRLFREKKFQFNEK